MSFSCPHFAPNGDRCLRLATDCVPGRRGCVLEGATFAVSVTERLRLVAEEQHRRTLRDDDASLCGAIERHSRATGTRPSASRKPSV